MKEMDLEDYRREIDSVDRRMIELFEERMRIAGGIAAYKRAHALPVLDKSREEQKLKALSQSASPEFAPYVAELWRKIFELSRAYQEEKQKEAAEGEGKE